MPVSQGEDARPSPSTKPSSGPPPPPPEPSDDQLLQRCRNGDTEAWGVLVARYERLVFSVAVRNGLSREDAADVTQTSFIALLEGIDALRDDERLPAWLMTVARRQSWRLRQRGEREQPPPDRTPPPDGIERWEQLTWLHTALRQLGEPCRELLVALYLDPAGPSYADIAARLGRAVGGLGPLRARCLTRLRSIMDAA